MIYTDVVFIAAMKIFMNLRESKRVSSLFTPLLQRSASGKLDRDEPDI